LNQVYSVIHEMENWGKAFVIMICFWFINELVLNWVDCLFGDTTDYLWLARYTKGFHLGTSQINVTYCCTINKNWHKLEKKTLWWPSEFLGFWIS
jgi:hypothetical protein